MTYVNRKACKSCDLRVRCTNAAFQKVAQYANEAILDRMAERLTAHPEVMDQRRESVARVRNGWGKETFSRAVLKMSGASSV